MNKSLKNCPQSSAVYGKKIVLNPRYLFSTCNTHTIISSWVRPLGIYWLYRTHRVGRVFYCVLHACNAIRSINGAVARGRRAHHDNALRPRGKNAAGIDGNIDFGKTFLPPGWKLGQVGHDPRNRRLNEDSAETIETVLATFYNMRARYRFPATLGNVTSDHNKTSSPSAVHSVVRRKNKK